MARPKSDKGISFIVSLEDMMKLENLELLLELSDPLPVCHHVKVAVVDRDNNMASWQKGDGCFRKQQQRGRVRLACSMLGTPTCMLPLRGCHWFTDFLVAHAGPGKETSSGRT
jgi:hypothetical protein